MDKGELNDLKDAGLSNDEIVKITQDAINIDPNNYKNMLRSIPHLAERVVAGLSEKVKRELGVDLSDKELEEGMTISQK